MLAQMSTIFKIKRSTKIFFNEYILFSGKYRGYFLFQSKHPDDDLNNEYNNGLPDNQIA